MTRYQAYVSLIPQLPSFILEKFPGNFPRPDDPEMHEIFKHGEDMGDGRRLLFNFMKTKHEIGRASSNPNKGVSVAVDNGYFKAPVMSRRHAEITMCEQTKTIRIADTGSMHGTYVNGERLLEFRFMVLRDGDIISFGTEVSRDGAVHRPRIFKVLIEWMENRPPTPESPNNNPHSNKITTLTSGYGVCGDDLIVSDGEPSLDPEGNEMQYSGDECCPAGSSDSHSSDGEADDDLKSQYDSGDDMAEDYDEEEDFDDQEVPRENSKSSNKVSIDNLMNTSGSPVHNDVASVSVQSHFVKTVTKESGQLPHQIQGGDNFWRNVLDTPEHPSAKTPGAHMEHMNHIMQVKEENAEESLEANLAKLRQIHASANWSVSPVNQTAAHSKSDSSSPAAAISNDVAVEESVAMTDKNKTTISNPETSQFKFFGHESRPIKPLKTMTTPVPSPLRAVTSAEPTKSRCSINDLVHQTPANHNTGKSHCPITPESLVKPTRMEIDTPSRGRKRGIEEVEEAVTERDDAQSDAGSDAESTSTRPDQTKFLSQSFRGLDMADEDETQMADELVPVISKATATAADSTAGTERTTKRARVWPQVTAGFALGTLTGAVGLFAALVASAPPA